ncbi:MAG: class I tRNA ligase family protein, partial [Chloroflexota bacterium]
MAELNILEAIRTAMDEELERDPNVMVLGEDVGKKGGVFGATEGLWAKYGGKRVLDTPLTEAMIAGEIHKFLLNGSLYRGSKPVMWSIPEQTALAEAEVEYKDITSDTVWVKFPIN